MIFIDAHVHIYRCFDLATFLDSALENFNKEAVRNGSRKDFSAVLFLTDWKNQNWFKHLTGYIDGKKRDSKNRTVGSWKFYSTNEPLSIYAEQKHGHGLYIVSGRKIITSENLEVLALATELVIDDNKSLKDTVREIRECSAIPVIPWAVGKWMGRRGRILKSLLDEEDGGYLLCDNGNRPVFWPRPSHFKLADKKGIRILSGSDPLHFTSETVRAGSVGVLLKESLKLKQPARELKEILLNGTTEFRLYGQLERPLRFLRNQILMQVLKRKWRVANSQN